jgi:hypothetical protein
MEFYHGIQGKEVSINGKYYFQSPKYIYEIPTELRDFYASDFNDFDFSEKYIVQYNVYKKNIEIIVYEY